MRGALTRGPSLGHGRGMAQSKKKAKKTSGPSGKHRNPQRLLSQSPEEWEAQDARAAERGVTWAEWARGALVMARVAMPTDDQSPQPPEPEPEPQKPGPMVRSTPPLTAEERTGMPHVEVHVPKRRKRR